MNALKNVLFFGLLIAVLFGVYISLNKQPDQSPLPAGMDVSTPPVQVDVPPFNADSTPNGPPNINGGSSGFPPPVTRWRWRCEQRTRHAKRAWRSRIHRRQLMALSATPNGQTATPPGGDPVCQSHDRSATAGK